MLKIMLCMKTGMLGKPLILTTAILLSFSAAEAQKKRAAMNFENLSNSDRADAASAAKIARILGADAIIIGSVTQVGRDDKKTNVGAGVGR